jgi:citrate synthase
MWITPFADKCLQVAKMPTIAAIAYKTHLGQPIVYPRSDLTYTENFLNMLFALPTEPYEVDPVSTVHPTHHQHDPTLYLVS